MVAVSNRTELVVDALGDLEFWTIVESDQISSVYKFCNWHITISGEFMKLWPTAPLKNIYILPEDQIAHLQHIQSKLA